MNDLVSNFSREMAPPSAKWMRMRLLEHSAANMIMKLEFEPNDHMINFGGTIQGGFLVAMMDDAMGFNAFVALDMKRALATIDLHTHFLKPVPKASITVETTITSVGRSIIFCEAKLYNNANDLAASATASMKIKPVDGFTEIDRQ